MYMAIVLACYIEMGKPECFEAHDEYGPYVTKPQCVARAAEMERQINTVFPHVWIQGWKCERGDAT